MYKFIIEINACKNLKTLLAKNEVFVAYSEWH